MKRIALYFALAATLVSCSEKIERVEKDSQDGVSAAAVDFIFDGAATKTTITQQGLAIVPNSFITFAIPTHGIH